MSTLPPAREPGLIELLYGKARRFVRAWWLSWRRPKFGQPVVDAREPSSSVRMRNQLSLFGGQSEASVGVTRPPTVATTSITNLGDDGTDTLWHWRIDGWTLVALLGAVLSVGLRLYRLDSLQAEMYGDIEIVQTYVRGVLAGTWPWYYALSSGPLYHYVIAPLIWLMGDGYDQIKLTSVVVSVGIVVMTYLTARVLIDRKLAAWSVVVVGSGSWLLVFSRLGNSQIFVPALVIGSILALVMYLRTQQIRWLVVSAVVATCGLYSYPQAFVIAPVMLLTVAALWYTQVLRRRTDIGWYAVAVVVTALPFLVMYIQDPASITGDYISEKIVVIDNPIGRLGEVIMRGIGAYFVQGDRVFRSNPAFLPHIDILSSVLLLVGIWYWLQPERRALAPLLLVPLVLLHVPSLLVLRYPEQVPSASRTLGVAPLVYLLVANGWYVLYRQFRARWSQYVVVVFVVLIGVSLQQNVDRYFGKYVPGMPYDDVPIGREIVRYAEMLSPDTTVYVAGCCWEDGIPEPFFSQIQMTNPDRLQRFDPAETLTCDALQAVKRPAVFIWSFHTPLPSPNVAACANEFLPVLHTTTTGVPLFYASAVSGLAMPRIVVDDAPLMDDGSLVMGEASNDSNYALLPINGVMTEIETSPLDTGMLLDLFDGNPDSLIKGDNQNPMVLDLVFASPMPIATVQMQLAGMRDFVVSAITVDGDGVMQEYTQDYPDADPDQVVSIAFDETIAVTSLTIRIQEVNTLDDELVYIHVRSLDLLAE